MGLSFANILTYIFLFASLNFEIFLLITYFETRGEVEKEKELVKNISRFPTVTVIVPCWNEQDTVSKTIYSLLDLNYPKDKLKIMAINDGSTDGTFQVLQEFKNNPQVEIYSKENGGKHTALNFALGKATSELIGCLDADSYVDAEALKNIVVYFENKEIMAVAPSVKLWKPKNILELFQKVEYGFGIFTRKMFHYMDAIYITPGPFSIFRKEVFEKLGGYREAHKTEDIELALRMQKNHFRIAHAHEAIVYTVPPNKIRPLLKQRVRWSHGFIRNAFDYRDMFFKKEYGNVGMFILPIASISYASVISVAVISVVNFFKTAHDKYIQYTTVGIHPHLPKMLTDWFYINTQLVAVIAVFTFIGSLAMIIVSRKMSEDKFYFGLDLLYYLALYMVLAPIWMSKALYNALFKVKASWR